MQNPDNAPDFRNPDFDAARSELLAHARPNNAPTVFPPVSSALPPPRIAPLLKPKRGTDPDIVSAWGVDVGDVLAVKTGNKLVEKVIDLGEALAHLPDKDNHVIVVTHFDVNGIPQGLQGQPGGIGLVDCRPFLTTGPWAKFTSTNHDQPRTNEDRDKIANLAGTLIGLPYDWQGIANDAMRALGLKARYLENWHDLGYPGHLVCSSFAAYVYMRLNLGHPCVGTERECTPGDWDLWNTGKGWAV